VTQRSTAPASAPGDRAAALAKAAACSEQGDKAWFDGDLERAHDLYRCSVERRERYMLDSQKELLESRLRLAETLSYACRYTEAKELFGLVRAGTRPSPRLTFLGGYATLGLSEIAWARGYRAEAVRLVRDVAGDCERVAPRVCNSAHSILALFARSFPGSERPAVEPLVRQLDAPRVTPYGRQFTRLAIYEVLKARGETEAAARFAEENQILASSGPPWPTSAFATATECSAPISWNEATKLARDQRRALAPMDDCVDASPLVDAQRPPAVNVTILLAPDGTTTSVDVAGTAISPQVLECVSTAAGRFTAPAVAQGYRVYVSSFRRE
jgi:hypothetical protein